MNGVYKQRTLSATGIDFTIKVVYWRDNNTCITDESFRYEWNADVTVWFLRNVTSQLD